jgi:hypothetical protein
MTILLKYHLGWRQMPNANPPAKLPPVLGPLNSSGQTIPSLAEWKVERFLALLEEPQSKKIHTLQFVKATVTCNRSGNMTVQLQELARSTPPTELNNGAIAYWAAGHVSEAMELLQLALSRLSETAFDHCHSKPTPVGGAAASSDAPNRRRAEVRHPLALDASLHATTTRPHKVAGTTTNSINPYSVLSSALSRSTAAQDHHHDASFLTLYDRAFLVDTKAAATADHNDDDDDDIVNADLGPCLLLAVVLYNMALLHHTSGLDQGQASYLTSARQLYQLALGIVQPLAHPPSLLWLALCNNVAHIDSYLVRVADMKHHLQQMSRVLQCDDWPDLDYDDDDYMIFYLNAMFGEENNLVVAPAA